MSRGNTVIFFVSYRPLFCGPGSSVGIATDHGLDGPGIESRLGEIFRPSRPVLGPTQTPGGKVRPGHVADHSNPTSALVMEE